MIPNPRPIGIFDSGVGGLTVLRAIRERLPSERLVYLGDTAHLPYGSKSPEAVAGYALQAGRLLVRERIKVMVVACNTASAVALADLRRALAVPVLGVIEPGAKAAVHASRNGRVGVIGTEATVQSGAYETALKRLRPGVRVVSAACPVFVPLVEEGWWEGAIARAVARRYLGALGPSGIDTLILGCTHYPLLKSVIRGVMGPAVRLVDSAEETAREVEALLAAERLLAPAARRRGRPSPRFFVSDAPARFKRLARRLLGLAVGKVGVRRID